MPTIRKISGHAKGSSVIHRYIHVSKEDVAKESLEKQMEEESEE